MGSDSKLFFTPHSATRGHMQMAGSSLYCVIYFQRGLALHSRVLVIGSREKEEEKEEEKEREREEEEKNLQIAIRCLWDLFD